MWTLFGFSDEISDDFTEQCTVAKSLGLRYIEFRSAWRTNILDLGSEQLERSRQILTDHGLSVSSIGSPIGKIFLDEDFEPHLERAGDGEVTETVRALRDDGFDGFFSLEPHLGEYTAFGALSGPQLFTKAWQAFTDMKKEGIAYA